MKAIKNYLSILTTPSCWLRNYPSSRALSAKLNKLLDNPEFTDFTGYTVKLNGEKFWVSNYPYAYGSPYYAGHELEQLPNRATVFRLHEALSNFLIKSENK